MKKKYFSSAIILLLAFINGKAQNATALYNEGLELKKQNKAAEALKKFKEAITLKAGYTEALYEAGWCQNELKAYGDAIKSLRTVFITWPKTAKVNFELGYAFEKSGKTDSALVYYNRCLDINPDYSSVYRQLGNIAYEKEEYAKGLEQFEKYEAKATTPTTDYSYWYRKGYMYNAIKKYAEAKTALLKSEASKNDNINTFNELGFSCKNLKQDEEAINYFKKAMALNPKSHIPYNGIGEVYRDNKKDMAEAMKWYRQVLDMNATERKANFGMAYCLNSTGKYSDAIKYLQTAVTSEPTYTAAYVELGYSHYKTNKPDEALKHLEKALSLNPKNENARYYSGLIFIDKKDKAKAQKMVDELKGLSSKLADGLQKKVNAM